MLMQSHYSRAGALPNKPWERWQHGSGVCSAIREILLFQLEGKGANLDTKALLY